MPVYTHVNRAGTRAAFALVILIILGLTWLIRFAVRAVGNHRAAHAAPGAGLTAAVQNQCLTPNTTARHTS